MGTEYWNGAEAAHRRVMMKAAGYSDKDIRKKPHIGVPNSYMAGSPGSAHLRQIAEAVKEGIWAAGGIPVEFGIPILCSHRTPPFMKYIYILFLTKKCQICLYLI